MRNALAPARKTQRRMVSMAIGTVFVQESPDNARVQWRSVADQRINCAASSTSSAR
jgi:putative transposase